MAQIIEWDAVGERFYFTGVDRGVLYVPTLGVYDTGFAWNGLVNVNEQPSGAEPNPQYADNIKYLNLLSAEELALTIEAFTYPKEFRVFDGAPETSSAGLRVTGQTRGVFGLSYRSLIGNDVDQEDHGYMLKLVYGCQASPSERANATMNDSPEPNTFSWEVTTTPVAVTGFKPTAMLEVDTRDVSPTGLAALETILYGDDAGPTEPRLPLPDEVITTLAA